MAEGRQAERPLSPHMSIYRPQITSMMSIVHRMTGVGLALGAVLIIWWFIAGATSPAYFEFVDGLLTSTFGSLILIGSLWAFWYHFFNGIRHLRWDAGKGLGIGESNRSGWRVVVFSVVFTIASIWLVMGGGGV